VSTRLAYTIDEACAAARVGRTTLYKAILKKQLRAVKWGRRTLIPAESLHALFKELRTLETATSCGSGGGCDPSGKAPEGRRRS
jgi:excisionase family DNA binding protein